MDAPVTIWLPEEPFAAVEAMANTHGRTPEQQVEAWIADELRQAVQRLREQRWAKRRRVLDTNPGLAAQVDGAP